ncbi:hypothetical protein AOQ84DRAFT_282984 [Glonium stellatum]|uniref:Sulfotransferase n=1 Tax=Glonium stellatum TaxID=574774 RepID=A0A8E2JXR1_9PEZI|nr:hypothetical protein AOQ84DRAFT_282984 [Glonium stellatum]
MIDWTGKIWVDRRGMKRVVPMEVLVLGLGRTGSMSMVAALQKLGYDDVYHMSAAIANPPDIDMWQEAIDAKYFGKGKPYGRQEWDQLLGHCMAVTDFPTAAFPEELIAAYPDAKVILTTRDPEKWYQSVYSTLRLALESRSLAFAGLLDRPFLGKLIPMMRKLWIGFFGIPDVRPQIKDRFIEHNRAVKAMTPPDKYLEYRVGEGWDRLCEFLGKPVPEEEFPRVNETASFEQLLQKMLKGSLVRSAKNVAKIFGPLAAVGVAVYFAKTQSLL